MGSGLISRTVMLAVAVLDADQAVAVPDVGLEEGYGLAIDRRSGEALDDDHAAGLGRARDGVAAGQRDEGGGDGQNLEGRCDLFHDGLTPLT